MARLTPIIEGKDGAETLVFVQGYPDDHTLWNDVVPLLRERYRIVRVDMPNYGSAERTRWAYGTDALVNLLGDLLDEVSPGRPVTFVGHDWGAYWGYVLHARRPESIHRFVGLDVAPHYKPRLGAVLGILTYQSILYAAFLIGGPVGNAMTRVMAKLMRAPKQGAELSAWMNYPYRNGWADLFTGLVARETKHYFPRCPQFYAYGENKLFHFHSQNWLDYLATVEGSLVLPLDTDHWVQRSPRLAPELASWLARTDEACGAGAQPSAQAS